MSLVTLDTRGAFLSTPNRTAILGRDGQSRQALKRMLDTVRAGVNVRRDRSRTWVRRRFKAKGFDKWETRHPRGNWT